MKTKHKRLYAEISKLEPQDDGTIKVWGYASSGVEDLDGEVITPDAMKAALPEYMKWGAVREMHGSSAAGVAIEAAVQDDGKTWFGAHVVDPVAVKKVETGVYKGFSVGGKVTERDTMNKAVIKGINLIEVSLVDRPCNPEAVFVLNKAARTTEDDVEELADLLDAGTVTPAQLLAMVKSAGTTPGTTGTPEDQQVVPGVTPLKGVGDPTELLADDASKTAGSDEPKTDPAIEDVVEKGMYTVSDFGSMLSNLSYICEDTAWETQVEGDGSTIPEKLRAWLKTGIGIFQAMAKEEAEEMMGRVTATVEAAKAAKGEPLTKAGARFSKATKEALGKIHAACNEAADHLGKLGYQDAEEDDDGDGATKAATADTNGILTPDEEVIAKAVTAAIAPINDDLAKARKENDDLRKQIDDLKKQPAPGKALIRAINKAADTATAADEPASVAEVAPPEGTPERAAFEMRKALAQPRRLVG